MRRMYSLNQLEEQTENLLASGNLPSVKADEIIENMEGYSVLKKSYLNWNAVYVGVCKNGNKITFVIFGYYTYATGDQTNEILNFTIPSNVGTKLFPYTIGGFDDVLSLDEVSFYSTLTVNNKITLSLRKNNNTDLVVALREPNDAGLTNGTTYYFRYERTFLLSDNLID